MNRLRKKRTGGFGSSENNRMIENGKTKTQYVCQECGYVSPRYLVGVRIAGHGIP